jgi:enoyl-CoA hydratase/carnithine racemase
MTDIDITLVQRVATIEIQRPPHNFFDRELIRQIADALEALDETTDCRAVVLASDGKSFCAGANLGGNTTDPSGDEDFSEAGFRERVGLLYGQGARLFGTRKPIVAAIQGPAIGGGLGLALVADFRVAAPTARFCANFTKLGLHPGFALSVTLPALVGQQEANKMFLTARRLKAEEALKIGLVDELVPLGEVRARSIALAGEIAANAPLAVQSVRATLRQGLVEKVVVATRHELKEQQWLRETQDAKEGIRAVAERRDGNFSGR